MKLPKQDGDHVTHGMLYHAHYDSAKRKKRLQRMGLIARCYKAPEEVRASARCVAANMASTEGFRQTGLSQFSLRTSHKQGRQLRSETVTAWKRSSLGGSNLASSVGPNIATSGF